MINTDKYLIWKYRFFLLKLSVSSANFDIALWESCSLALVGVIMKRALYGRLKLTAGNERGVFLW